MNGSPVTSTALEDVAEHIARAKGNVAGFRSEFLDADGDHLIEIGGERRDRLRYLRHRGE